MLCDPADALSRPDGSSGVWRPSGDATEKASEVPRRERGSSSLSCTEGMPLEVFDELKDMLIDGGLGSDQIAINVKVKADANAAMWIGSGSGSGEV